MTPPAYNICRNTRNLFTRPLTAFLLLLPFQSEAHSDAKTGNLKAAMASVSQQIMTVTSKQEKKVVEGSVPSKHQGLLTPWSFVLFTLPLNRQNHVSGSCIKNMKKTSLFLPTSGILIKIPRGSVITCSQRNEDSPLNRIFEKSFCGRILLQRCCGLAIPGYLELQ